MCSRGTLGGRENRLLIHGALWPCLAEKRRLIILAELQAPTPSSFLGHGAPFLVAEAVAGHAESEQQVLAVPDERRRPTKIVKRARHLRHIDALAQQLDVDASAATLPGGARLARHDRHVAQVGTLPRAQLNLLMEKQLRGGGSAGKRGEAATR